MPVSMDDVSEYTVDSFIMVKTKKGDEKLEFSYRPHAYTPQHEARSNEVRKDGVNSYVLCSLLAPTLAHLDLAGKDGALVECTEEGLASVPVHILTEVLGKINEELDPGKSKNSASRGSFKA